MMPIDAHSDILQLKSNNEHQYDGLKYLWIELENQKQLLKLIISQKEKKQSKKGEKLLKTINVILPYLNLKTLLQMRLVNRQFLTEVNNNKQIIINQIAKELEASQNTLYRFDLTKQISRELYLFIVKLNYYANKANELSLVPQQMKKIILQISDTSQIKAFEIATQIEEQYKTKNKYEKKIESEIMKGYFHVANGPIWQGNVTLVNEYKLYQLEMKRQKKQKNLRILTNIIQGM